MWKKSPNLVTLVMGDGCLTHLVERTLALPVVRGSKPVVGKIYIEKTKIKGKRPGIAL